MITQYSNICINTDTGTMQCGVYRPEQSGRFSTVIFYSEIFQRTEPIERSAKIIASHGFVVVVPEAGDAATSLLQGGLPGLISVGVYLFLVPFLVFFFMKDKDLLLNSFIRYMPRERGLINSSSTRGQYRRWWIYSG